MSMYINLWWAFWLFLQDRFLGEVALDRIFGISLNLWWEKNVQMWGIDFDNIKTQEN